MQKREVGILIVDDDKGILDICKHFLEQDGWKKIYLEQRPSLAISKVIQNKDIGVVFLDLKFPGEDGIDTLKTIKSARNEVEVIIFTAYGTVRSAVECIRCGAYDYIQKPFKKDRFLHLAENAAKVFALKGEVEELSARLKKEVAFENIIGFSAMMKTVFEKMKIACQTDFPILITGESGTGKDLVAKTIHYNSMRRKKPFIAINCAAIPSELIESELFGYKKGAFTGATSDSVGLFRAADGGTLFLDEIVEMPPSTQSKLLRVLQEKTVRPLGETVETPVDVRVLCATNRDISEVLKDGLLREDLYYRISTMKINIPPLRNRREDIASLVKFFILKLNKKYNRNIKQVNPDTLQLFMDYDWPGNVRELENVLEFAFAMTGEDMIKIEHIPDYILWKKAKPGEIKPLEQVQKEMVINALEVGNYNKTLVCKMLGISRKRLYRLMKKYKIPFSKP
jgi:DNA-binding NtrC family response regulator